MGQFLRQVLVQDETLNVSTTRTDDLPVNPLSVIFFTFKFTNSTATLTNYSIIRAALASISKVEVLFQGSAVVSGSLADLARMNALLIHHPPHQIRMTHTNADVRAVTIPILLGRRPYWMQECFPAVRRGELQLQTTVAAAQTGVATPILQVETVELLGASPSRFLKYTTISKTPAATGDHDMDLPIGNKIAGVLLFGTTPPSGASFNASIDQLRLLVDNVEAYYARANWETLNGEIAMRALGGVQSSDLTILENLAGAYTQNATSDKQNVNPDFFEEYSFLDLDPLTDDQYLLDTKGRARIHLRINAQAADAVRVMPLELVDVSQAGA
jgi:hypothetical protein